MIAYLAELGKLHFTKEEMAEGTHRLFTIYGAAEDSDDDREETE